MSTTTTQQVSVAAAALPQERADLLELLRTARGFLRYTVRGLDETQVRLRPTASELCPGGVVKHVTAVERQWVAFLEGGAGALTTAGEDEWARGFALTEDDTMEALLADYDAVAAHTDDLVATLPDLDASHPLPEAPWFAPGARWSARRALLHIAAETAQHAGHADILRETIDGQKTMG
ncbi:uncharacterized protein DUF664 [Motilibacter peucedani]|uniref:Uncharacterized protein DUF664 n=1 Tax=Motilibacter peucedani TaxID=598650 RepID=A0A420XVF9_9ACTN|nr:DinB family protein [Motilibacter peucedani]RKS84275.1 uncharacterized protein DUF664 [Motilibacter peucedani]